MAQALAPPRGPLGEVPVVDPRRRRRTNSLEFPNMAALDAGRTTTSKTLPLCCAKTQPKLAWGFRNIATTQNTSGESPEVSYTATEEGNTGIHGKPGAF